MEAAVTMLPAAPGDVLAVSAGPWLVREVIELEERMRGLAAPVDHVVIITHLDAAGRWIGIQGQPGGVGLVDCTPYLRAKVTRSNFFQPKPAEGSPEMNAFLASCAKSLGVRYDWAGIADDAVDALHLHDLSAVIDRLWKWPAKHGMMPGEVVCSSLAAELYELHGWPHPDLGSERQCEPSSWWLWNDQHQWESVPAA
jgi:hypothetical protein